VPGTGGNQADSLSRGHGAARAGGNDVVGTDRQHIAHAALPDAPAQLAAALHFIADHEGSADPQGVRAV
jgi:hypothetical protein